MRKNRKMSKKMSVMATNTLRFGAILLSFFVMVILYILSLHSCTQLQNQKGARERNSTTRCCASRRAGKN